MTQTIPGIHHVTAIAIDPQANIDFYTQALGLRFVKETVNFDDPGTYHFYYGDRTGRPGTIPIRHGHPRTHRQRHGRCGNLRGAIGIDGPLGGSAQRAWNRYRWIIHAFFASRDRLS